MPFDYLGGLALSLFMAYLFTLTPLLLLALGLPYALLKLRDAQNRRPDPQLGFRAANHFFFSLAVLLMLSGLSNIVSDTVRRIGAPVEEPPGRQPPFGQPFGPPTPPSEFPSEAQRTGAAFFLSGGLFAAAHFAVILLLTRDRNPSPTRRIFLGCRCAVHGLVVMFALTALLVVLFQRWDTPANASLVEMRKSLIGMLLIWVPSAVAHFWLLWAASISAEEARRRREEDSEQEDE
jgi:hypothetical protein